MSELRVVSVSIRDVLGAREFALEPGALTVIEGKNGSGKSSALQAVQAALGGGNLAKLARVDASGDPTEPEVVLVLEGPGNETYRVERTGDKVRVRSRVGQTAGFEDVAKPQTWLSGLFDADLANPVKFLTAPDKERALLLLEALPLKFDRAGLLKEMGITPEELHAMGSAPAGLHPLEEIAYIREAVFRTRTGVNRDEKQQRASAEQLRRNLPAVPPEDPGGEAQARLEARVVELEVSIARETQAADSERRRAEEAAEATYAAKETEIATSFKASAADLRRKHEQKAAELRAEAERRITEDLALTNAAIEALREGGEVAIAEWAQQRTMAIDGARQARETARSETDKLQSLLGAQREQLAELRAMREGAAKASALAEQAQQFDNQADELTAKSERLTSAIGALDAHRRRLAEELPIPGLEIQDREIRVNGVRFEQLNTAQRVDIAVQVATLRARGRRLPVLFVDGAEALDKEHFDHLCRALKKSGIQAFIGRVAEGQLRVTADGAGVPA
jgi:energy-coupling factor transporter ATP-binding protein EcfA2